MHAQCNIFRLLNITPFFNELCVCGGGGGGGGSPSEKKNGNLECKRGDLRQFWIKFGLFIKKLLFSIHYFVLLIIKK